MFAEYHFRSFNFRLLFYAAALSMIGVVIINSAVGEDKSYVTRQLIGLFGGIMIAVVLYRLSGDPFGGHYSRTAGRLRRRIQAVDHAAPYRTVSAVGVC